jgi:transposase
MTEQTSHYQWYVGVDWGSESHQVCVTDADGQVRQQRSVRHDGAALTQLGTWLLSLAEGDPARIAVAIEVPRGPVVEALVERGLHVYAINPKQLDRFRDRFTVAGAKDDRRDALVLASSLRTDRDRFRHVKLDDPVVIQLRELSRAHDELVAEQVRLSNRLRDTLLRYFPQALHVVPAADEPWLWELLELAPCPAEVQRLSPRRTRGILRKHRVRRYDETAVLQQLRATALPLAPGTVEACVAHVRLVLPQLRVVREQVRSCDRQLGGLLAQLASDEGADGQKREHRDAEILLSHPGIGTVVAATMLAEASEALGQRDYHALRGQAGAAPVTRASGKSRGVVMRRACNGRLRDALHYWMRTSIIRDPPTREHYAELRSRGHNHSRAVRGVADRRLKILVATLRDGTLYDPTRLRRVSAGDRT